MSLSEWMDVGPASDMELDASAFFIDLSWHDAASDMEVAIAEEYVRLTLERR